MKVLLIILALVFAGVAVMVVLGERFAKPMDDEQMSKLSRWVIPLVAVSLVLSLVKYYW